MPKMSYLRGRKLPPYTIVRVPRVPCSGATYYTETQTFDSLELGLTVALVGLAVPGQTRGDFGAPPKMFN